MVRRFFRCAQCLAGSRFGGIVPLSGRGRDSGGDQPASQGAGNQHYSGIPQHGGCGEIHREGAGHEPQQGGYVRPGGGGLLPQPRDRGDGPCGAAGVPGVSLAERKGMAGARQYLYGGAGEKRLGTGFERGR